jgi:catechol 2,3-dioxygenase-like lactoylglutathione lyase family enzyme
MTETIDKLLAMYECGAINRRQLLATLTAATLATPAPAQPPDAPFQGRVINHVTLSVSDVARSREFYTKLLGATDIGTPPASGPLKLADLRVGDSFIGLYPLGNPGRIDHFSIGIDNYDPAKALHHLKQHYAGNEPSVVVAGGGAKDEVYLKDPDGIRVQLSDVDLKLT